MEEVRRYRVDLLPLVKPTTPIAEVTSSADSDQTDWPTLCRGNKMLPSEFLPEALILQARERRTCMTVQVLE